MSLDHCMALRCIKQTLCKDNHSPLLGIKKGAATCTSYGRDRRRTSHQLGFLLYRKNDSPQTQEIKSLRCPQIVNVRYCIVSIHLCSASCSAHQSEAISSVRDPKRREQF